MYTSRTRHNTGMLLSHFSPYPLRQPRAVHQATLFGENHPDTDPALPEGYSFDENHPDTDPAMPDSTPLPFG